MVLNSHQAGLPVETVSAVTGLTVEQITGILKRNALI
jgi:hypothetical protein